MRLENKVVLITGSAQGIGAAIARHFAEEGACVMVCDLDTKRDTPIVPAITEKGGTAIFQPLDVTRDADWIAAIDVAIKKFVRLDVLVNNAGINIREPIEAVQEQTLDTMLAVNVKGPMLGIKHVIPVMRRAGGGAIINISSICGLIGHQFTTETYTVTKGAITLLTKSVGVRYAKDNIRCNSIHPSTVDTPYIQTLFHDPERKAERLGEIPLGRLATDIDVANAAVYLASDEAAFLNGVALPVDGGLTAY